MVLLILTINNIFMKKALLSILSMGLLIVSNSAFAAVTVTDVTNGAEIRGITTPADAS